MAKSLNKVMLIGHLGKDPELRYTSNGVAVASFSIATNESWKDQDGNVQERTDWHNIVAWRRLAEICGEYLKKGARVYIEGKIQTRSYDDKNGVKRYITEIVADDLIMLDGRTGGAEATAGQPSSSSTVNEPARGNEKDDDLPF
jgi:single-strand DNA-binding protein